MVKIIQRKHNQDILLLRSKKRHLLIGVHGLIAAGFILLAAALRVLLAAQGWPAVNSDEGTMGLMARHIAYRGEHPIFFYGQNYMGSLEAYLGAILFHVFGPSSFALRLGTIFLFACFLLVSYHLISLLYTKKLALVALILLSLGTDPMLQRQIVAVGGAMETLVFGALSLFLVTLLALSLQKEPSMQEHRRQYTLLGVLGLAVGLGIWSHLLIMPFVLMAAIFFLVFCRRLITLPAMLFLGLGFLIGLTPLIIFNITNITHNSARTFLDTYSVGLPILPYYQFLGTFAISLPMAIGANPLTIPLDASGGWRTHVATLFPQLGWSLGFLLLWTFAVYLTVADLRRNTRISGDKAVFETKRAQIRYTARLMLLGGAGLTILAYLLSPTSAATPAALYRYLTGVLIGLPAIVASIASHIQITKSRLAHGTAWVDIFKVAIVVAILLLYLRGTITLWQDIPSIQAIDTQQTTLIKDLTNIHIRHLYSDYWTCNWLIFESDEQLICSSVDETLHVRQNRYQPYVSLVEQDKRAAYVFVVGSPQDHAFQRQMSRPYRRVLLPSTHYAVYQPAF